MKYNIIWLTIFYVFFGNECFGIKPIRNYINTPSSLKMNYEQALIHTSDNYNIKSWIIFPEGNNDKKTVIIFAYGDSGNMSFWLHRAKLFSSNGFTVVLFDYRGFGESSDFSINPNFLYYNEFANDLISVIKWVKKKMTGKKIGIYGFSMGTIMATIALQEENLDFYIAESLVYNPNIIVSKINKLKKKKVFLPKKIIMDKDLYNNIKCKMLIFSGSKDKLTTLDESKIVAAEKKNRKLIEFNGNHAQAIQSLGNKYIKIILQFLS